MNKKRLIKNTLLASFLLLALPGWLLHARIHPPPENAAYLIPFIAGLVSTLILTVLFCFRRTITLAYIVNGFLVIIGTITMSHHSVAELSKTGFQPPLTLVTLFTTTLLLDILIAWAKFCIGKAIFDLETLKADTNTVPRGRFWRWPNMGWWWVHLVGLTAVYAVGHLLWK